MFVVVLVSNKQVYSNNEENSTKQELIDINLDLPQVFKPGSSFIVYVTTKRKLTNPKISFNKNETNLFKIADNEYRALAAIDANAKSGNYELKVYDESGFLNYSKIIKVNPAKFPVHFVSIIQGIETIKTTKQEKAKIIKVIKSITEVSYWKNRPFIVPTKGHIIVDYGTKRYINEKPTGVLHNGQDIKAPIGTPVVAISPGKIMIAASFFRRGNNVVIDHGQGLLSEYLHMSKLYVNEGDIVKQGQTIGEVGTTGFTTLGSILHWGIYVNGITVNPNEWIKK